MEWTKEAKDTVEVVLEKVPTMVKGMVMEAATLASEEKAYERASDKVELEDAVKGLIKAAPFHMRKRLKEEMKEKGIDVDSHI